MELLAPCGNEKTLKAAVQAGANAVYFGAEKFSARAFAGNFACEKLADAIKFANDNGVKAYLAINTLITDRELREAVRIIDCAREAGAAAFILQDIGLASVIKKRHANIVLHASTQTTASTLEDVNTLAKSGFSRVVLARELSRTQIKKIAENSKTEIEIFVHGALCSSYSGQCLMSSFIGGRSANRGKCAQPCRLPYKSGKKNGVLLSLKDLCLIDHVNEFAEIGVASLKIEGRMKGEEYVRTVVGAYRAALEGKPILKEQLLKVFDRGGYTNGYYTGNHSDMYMRGLRNPYA
jgi:collagenase-like PrtC family protease